MPNAREDISETGTVGGLLAQLIDKDLDRRIVVMDAGFIRPIRPGDVKFSKFHYNPDDLSDSEDLCLISPGPVDVKGLKDEVWHAAKRLAKGFVLETGDLPPSDADRRKSTVYLLNLANRLANALAETRVYMPPAIEVALKDALQGFSAGMRPLESQEGAALTAHQRKARAEIIHTIERLMLDYNCLLYTSPSPRDS